MGTGKEIWIKSDGKIKRRGIELSFELIQYEEVIIEKFRLRPPQAKDRHPDREEMDVIVYYITDGGRWVRHWFAEDEINGNIYDCWDFEHPIQVAHDFLWAGRKPHASIHAEHVATARDDPHYTAWQRGTEYRAWCARMHNGQNNTPPDPVTEEGGRGGFARREDGQSGVTAKPKWDRTKNELYFGNKLCRRYDKRATNQIALLDAFEHAEWPKELINNPFADDEKLDQTVKDFNSYLRLKGKDLFYISRENSRVRWLAGPTT